MSGSHTHCSHHSAENITEGRLKAAIGLTFAFVVAEGIAGARANSLALLSDAGHNFTDGLALALSWYALRLSRRPATSAKTFGYHRAGILTALFNAVTLLLIAAVIVREATGLLVHPQHVASVPMMVVATCAIALNLTIALGIRGEAAHSVNMRSAYIHTAGDVLASLGVVAAGVAIKLTGWAYADPIVSVLIAGLIAYSSWGIVSETLNVLLEGTPRGMDLARMASDIESIPGVDGVHDLHVWTIGDHMNALSCHLSVREVEPDGPSTVVKRVKAMLAHDYEVGHSTIETECTGCNDDELYCQLGARSAPCSHSH